MFLAVLGYNEPNNVRVGRGVYGTAACGVYRIYFKVPPHCDSR